MKQTSRRKIAHSLMIVIAMCGSACLLSGQATDLGIHDPSTLVKEGGTYWVFGTGVGCPYFSSTNRVHWTLKGSIFSSAPAWVKDIVPGNTRNNVWAPDIRLVKGKYYLYYSYSTFGRNISAIGLAISKKIDTSEWVDQGMVIRSERTDNFNAIDPAITQSQDGKLWLSFGSFWSGIKMIELNPLTGMRLSPDSPIYSLAKHPQDRANSIEAPFIHFHKGYYYLFVNWDYCCRGNRSTYNIRVGRSKKITGPYLDVDGVDMLVGGGTLVVGSQPDDGSGKPFDDKVGPGHAGILTEKGIDRFSMFYEYVRERNGRPTMEIGIVDWGKQGWPKVIF